MTGHELLALAGQNPQALGALLGAPCAAALALQAAPATDWPRGPLAYVWSAIVYAASVPGIMAIVTLLYLGLGLHKNVLETDLLLAFGPIVAMVAVLWLVGRKVPISALPGVDRLGGMLLMLAATFAMLFMLDRTRIMVLFHGGIGSLLLIGLGLFVVFKFGFNRLFGRRPPAPPSY